MIITLAGLNGAGKSTIRELLGARLGYKTYSMGDLRGKMALERGLTIDQLNELGMTEPFTDKEVDDFQTHLGQTEDDFIADGWLSWHFIPRSKKIFLDVDPRVGAERIFAACQGADRKDEPEYHSVEEVQENLKKRLEQTRARYKKWYGVDFMDLSQFDLVIDTTDLTPDEVVEKIVESLKS